MRRIRLSEISVDIAFAETQDRCADTRVRTELHDEIEREAVIRPTEEREEQVRLLAHAKRCTANEQCDVCTRMREHAAHKVGVE